MNDTSNWIKIKLIKSFLARIHAIFLYSGVFYWLMLSEPRIIGITCNISQLFFHDSALLLGKEHVST